MSMSSPDRSAGVPAGPVIAAVDLGPHSPQVLERAKAQAAVLDTTVTAVHCVAAPDRAAEAALSALVGEAGGGVAAARVVVGDPARGLAAEADASAASLVVLGASRRSFLEQVFRGDVTVALIRRSRQPILVARTPVAGGYRQALVAVDSAGPVAPVATAVRRVLGPIQAELFTVLDASVRLQMIVAAARPEDIEAYEEQSLAEAYKTLVAAAGAVAEDGWIPRVRVAEGVPTREIRARIAATAADLLVLQPETRGPFLRALIGSLTEELLARPLDCDVLVLPAQDTGRGEA